MSGRSWIGPSGRGSARRCRQRPVPRSGSATITRSTRQRPRCGTPSTSDSSPLPRRPTAPRATHSHGLSCTRPSETTSTAPSSVMPNPCSRTCLTGSTTPTVGRPIRRPAWDPGPNTGRALNSHTHPSRSSRSGRGHSRARGITPRKEGGAAHSMGMNRLDREAAPYLGLCCADRGQIAAGTSGGGRASRACLPVRGSQFQFAWGSTYISTEYIFSSFSLQHLPICSSSNQSISTFLVGPGPSSSFCGPHTIVLFCPSSWAMSSWYFTGKLVCGDLRRFERSLSSFQFLSCWWSL